jgi:hypothetical protein
MKINAPVYDSAFYLRTCVGCEFHRIDIDGGPQYAVGYGFYVRPDAADGEFFTVNHWTMCRFVFVGEDAIKIWATTASKTINTVTRCWFEHIQGHGVYAGGGLRVFHVADSYFSFCGESNASARHDIALGHSSGYVPRNVEVSNCTFMAAGTEAERRRISVWGACHVDVRNCNFLLGDSGQACVRLAGTPGQANLFDNSIVLNDGINTGEYSDLLVDDVPPSSVIQWRSRIHTSADSVTGADEPMTVNGDMIATNRLGTGFHSSTPLRLLGPLVKSIQIFDENGNPLGYVPVYASID